jgi:hypothetical protein
VKSISERIGLTGASRGRSVNFNYQASGGLDLGFNVHMKGPMLNATFKI